MWLAEAVSRARRCDNPFPFERQQIPIGGN
jgi:hypothetical protein